MSCLKPAELVRTEAAALEALAARLDGAMAADFERAVELIVRCGEGNGRVVVTGMGKSGIIAQKIAATLSSTGVAGTVSASRRSSARRPRRADARRRGDCALGKRRDRRDSAPAGNAQAQGRCAGELLLQSEVDTGAGERCGARLQRRARGLRAEPGAHGQHHGDAGAGRCAGRRGEPAQGIQGGGFCGTASRRQAGQATGQGPRPDARGRRRAGGDACNADDRRDLRDVVEEAGHDNGAGSQASCAA